MKNLPEHKYFVCQSSCRPEVHLHHLCKCPHCSFPQHKWKRDAKFTTINRFIILSQRLFYIGNQTTRAQSYQYKSEFWEIFGKNLKILNPPICSEKLRNFQTKDFCAAGMTDFWKFSSEYFERNTIWKSDFRFLRILSEFLEIFVW